MYAPGLPPTAPRRVPGRAWIVSMRVLFTLLAVCSIGMLLWAPLLRLAFVRRRALDWWIAGAGFVFVCALLPILGRDEPNVEAHGIDNVLIPLLLLVLAGACVHYLVADVRFHARLTGKAAGFPQPAPGYGYVTTVPVPTPPYGQPQPYPPHQQQPYPLPLTRCPQPEDARPAPDPRQHPAPQRIDQVRAELDELSDYLRKEEGR
ncbi:hypothetical protein K388_04744 [Streptomyces sp. KhCrAH-43]|uniref:hypothetical protein n=1 Tax=unclassified Streptomyces TaxID=2593676 RepID=UPI00036F1AD1|nr:MULTISPECIES: hypothetical protein [unclassified Streptomyces]MYS36049.1 hypothetical protein [Streptomyces sp. SID4920]MYX70678.1 hypothetical protein [Streptomyces sp. SID8373]RAJ55827.1 hypothetical protein K388_04744 [Streptomyces sp. KhCrAH-43]